MDAASKAQALQAELQSAVETYRNLQQEVQKNHTARQTFLQQKYENDVVLQELGLLQDDANVYKLIGPVLVKQDPVEARSNVEKRLEFIGGELRRLDSQLSGLEEKQQRTQQQLLGLEEAATSAAASGLGGRMAFDVKKKKKNC